MQRRPSPSRWAPLLALAAIVVQGCTWASRVDDPAERCGGLDSSESEPVCRVSLVELLTRPEVYSGRQVEVVGWLHLEFEGDALYLHAEDFERSIPQNALLFDAPEDFRKQSSRFNNQYCLVHAKFLAYEAWRSVTFKGGLIDVSSVLVIPKGRSPDRWRSLVEWNRSP